MLGVQNLKEILDFSLSTGEVVAGLQDGVDLKDLAPALSAAKKAPAALKDAALAWDEYLDLDDAEALELENFVVTEFDIANDRVEEVIEKTFKFAIELHDLVSMFKKPSA